MTTQLSQSQISAFECDGFLVAPGVVGAHQLAALRAAMLARVDDLLARYERIGYARYIGDDDLSPKLTHLLGLTPAAYQHVDISLPLSNDISSRLPDWQALFGDDWREQAGIFTDDTIFDLLTNEGIVSIARQLLGDEVEASPVQHARIKPPQRLLSGSSAYDSNTAQTLWHQDEAVVTEAARGVNILTVWVAITDATLENGCMQAVAGSHKAADTDAAPDFGLTKHCPGSGKLVGEIYIEEDAIARDKLTPLIANAGDVVLLHKRVVHGAGANESSGLRWSFDLRYQPAGAPSGRECFPSTVVASAAAPQSVVANAAEYRNSWLSARDAILNGEVEAVFNTRWNKYAPVCA